VSVYVLIPHHPVYVSCVFFEATKWFLWEVTKGDTQYYFTLAFFLAEIKNSLLRFRFYPQHYAPYLSDVKNFSDMKMEFDLATPFLPFEQLMAVLPAASKNLLPVPFQVGCRNNKIIVKACIKM